MAEGVEFIDECTIHVRGGRGGDGTTSFRREKHVPRGGPDGGDGGRGGDVILVADEGTTSLLDLHRNPHQRAEKGVRGRGDRQDGRHGEDLVVTVPVGTVVHDVERDEAVADLDAPGKRAVVAHGGRGGRGNASFATKHRRLPRFHEHGEVVPDRTLRLELKLIADVGLVGFPSAGKSSLIRALSAATPRVEAWHFTTLTPHLGVMRAGQAGDATDVVLADVPGLVEGAAEGKGLGHQFLRHIERCLVLVHVLDAAPFDPERDPVRDLEVLRDELRRYRPELLDRPQVVVLNKVDLPDGEAMAELYEEQLREAVVDEPIRISALTGDGLDTLRWRLAELVNEVRGVAEETATEPEDAPVVLRPLRARDDVVVNRVSSGAYRVASDRIERWAAMLPSDNREALRYLEGRLRRAGVEKALIKAGARKGDEVVIGELLFEFRPDPHQLPPAERDAALAAERAEEFGDAAEHDGVRAEELAADADLDADLDDDMDWDDVEATT